MSFIFQVHNFCQGRQLRLLAPGAKNVDTPLQTKTHVNCTVTYNTQLHVSQVVLQWQGQKSTGRQYFCIFFYYFISFKLLLYKNNCKKKHTHHTSTFVAQRIQFGYTNYELLSQPLKRTFPRSGVFNAMSSFTHGQIRHYVRTLLHL